MEFVAVSLFVQWRRLGAVVPAVPPQIGSPLPGSELGSLAEVLGESSLLHAGGPSALQESVAAAARVGFAVADDVLGVSDLDVSAVWGDDVADLVDASVWRHQLPPLFNDLAEATQSAALDEQELELLVEAFAVGVATAVVAAALIDASAGRSDAS